MPDELTKTVFLINRKIFQPTTLEAIANSKHGDFIECDPRELQAITTLIINGDAAAAIENKEKPKKGK